MIGGATAFAPAFRGGGEPASAPGSSRARSSTGGTGAMADLLDAVHSPGAQERTMAAPFGEVPGVERSPASSPSTASSTAGTWPPPPGSPTPRPTTSSARSTRSPARRWQPAMRDGDTFAAETDAPADAGPLERLVAFSGRHRSPTPQRGETA